MITDPIKANKILENDESDMIAMARAFLSNPDGFGMLLIF